MQVRLLKPGKGTVITYEGEPLRRDADSITVRTAWPGQPLDLGLIRLEPGDVFDEHFYADRWYNIFTLYGADGRLKGWYCNVARPAIIADDYVDSEDLEIDLIVAADGRLRLDDEDEFLARDLERLDPAAHDAALAAVEELRGMVARGDPPFDHQTSLVTP
jgi:hypothetical protein